MNIIERIAGFLNKRGFKTIVTPNNILVELSTKDKDELMSVYETKGIDAVDEKILDYGRKLEALTLSEFNRVAVKISGYDVDENNERIYLNIVPSLKLAKEKDEGDGSMADDEKEKKEEPKEKKDEEPKEKPKEKPKELSTSPEEVVVKEYEDVEKEFRKTLLEEVPVQEAVGIAHDILQDQGELSPKMETKIRELHKKVSNITAEEFQEDAVTKDEVDSLVNDAIDCLRNSPIDVALTTMQDVIKSPESPKPELPEPELPEPELPEPKIPNKEEKPEMDENKLKLMESRKKRFLVQKHLASLRRKVGQEGFDPVTDTFKGKDEGPFPTMNTDEIKKPNPEKEPEMSNEKPKQPKLEEMPTLSQEDYKKKSDRVLAMLKMAKDNGVIPQNIDIDDEFKKLMTYSDKKLDEFQEMISSAYEEKNDGLLMQDGKLADLKEMFGGD